MKRKAKYNVKHKDGIVTFAMRTGAVFVKGTMPLSMAEYHITTGKEVTLSDSRGRGMEICVDDTYFFPPADEVANFESDIADTDEVAE